MKPTLFNLDVETKEVDGNTVAEVDIDGIIGMDFWADEDDQNTKQKMREQLKRIDNIEADKIIVNISSLGGDVDHGLAIHDLLASNSARVETNVIGMTASAATIIAQAGDERFMSDNALYLVHRAWTIGMGNANDFDTLANNLRTLDDRISNIYAKRSEKDQDEFMDLMNESGGDGIWISAEEAEEYGLIDTIVEPMKAAASVDKSMFNRLGYPEPEGYEFIETTTHADKSEQAVVVNIDGDHLKKALETQRAFDRGDLLAKDDKESSNEESASAASREREKLELLKSKIS